jgi:signal peptidase I
MRTWLKNNRGFVLFLICFAFFRTAVADWNPIPSGSMRPTILEGDVVFVNRLAYDFKLPLTDIAVVPLGKPARGDIVTFSSPKDGTRLIKRIVGLPGDTIELRDDVLYLNGVAATYDDQAEAREPLPYFGSIPALHATESVAGSERSVQYLPDARARRNFGPIVVPADSYFMLGDNRDNSEDSRYIGTVPRELLIGRASRLVVSADIKDGWSPRLERIGKALR